MYKCSTLELFYLVEAPSMFRDYPIEFFVEFGRLPTVNPTTYPLFKQSTFKFYYRDKLVFY